MLQSQTQKQPLSENKASDIFRMNFYILEALYIRILQRMKLEYPEIQLQRDIDSMDFFYRDIMRSNRTDYSKYKNGSCGKTKITSTMERVLTNECPQLRGPLMSDELIKVYGISEKWVHETINKDSSDIRKECEEKVEGLVKNIVTECRKTNDKYKGNSQEDKIGIWIYRIIKDRKVSSSNAEYKIKAIIDELSKVNIDDIDRCSTKNLKKFRDDLFTAYQQFNKIYSYKELMASREKQ